MSTAPWFEDNIYKMKTSKYLLMTFSIFVYLPLALNGCGLIAGAAVGTAGAVSQTGYTVYQGGKLAVVSVGDAVSDSDDGLQGVVFTHGRFEVEAPVEITPVFKASYLVFDEMDYQSIKEDRGPFESVLNAKTSDGRNVSLFLKRVSKEQTAFSLKIGKNGDFEKSQLLYDKVLEIVAANSNV